MNTFKSFFLLEYKRLLSWRNAVALLWFLALSLILIQTGIGRYKDIEENKKKFQEIERQKVKQFNNYEQYGGYGFRLLFIPSPLSIFFNDTILFTELTSNIDAGEKLNIYNSLKGKNAFTQKPGQWLDFAGFIMLFGSFMALFFGYDSLRHKEYLKFLAGFYDYSRIFLHICLSRIISLCLFFIFVTFYGILLLYINGIRLTGRDFGYLMIFLSVIMLLLVFFFAIGTILASIKSKLVGFYIFLIWFLFVYLIPGGLDKWIEAKSQDIPPNYQLELNKLSKLMNFERQAIKKLKEGKSLKELAENYQKKEFVEIQKVELDLVEKMRKNVGDFHYLAIFSPTTFYMAVSKEMSSRGFENIIRFYEYAMDIKSRFIVFYKSNRYPGKTKTTPKTIGQDEESSVKRMKRKKRKREVLSFIKGAENLFMGEGILVSYFILGVFAIFIYVTVLFAASYLLFIRSLYYSPKEEIPGLSELEIDLKEEVSNVVLSSGKIIFNHLYNVLSGKSKDFAGTVIRNGINLVEENKKNDFVYICHSEDIPKYIRTEDFISFMGRSVGLSKKQLKEFRTNFDLKKLGRRYFKDLDKKDKAHILLETALTKNSAIYVFYDFANGLPADFIKNFRDRLNKIKEEGASILYFTNDVFLGRKIGDYISVLKKDAALMTINL